MAFAFLRQIGLISTGFCFLFSSCASASSRMNGPTFETVTLGSSVNSLDKYGKPISITSLPDGSKEYVYVERMWMGEEVVELTYYYITVKEGKIIAKRSSKTTPPAFDELYDPDPNDVELQ